MQATANGVLHEALPAHWSAIIEGHMKPIYLFALIVIALVVAGLVVLLVLPHTGLRPPAVI